MQENKLQSGRGREPTHSIEHPHNSMLLGVPLFFWLCFSSVPFSIFFSIVDLGLSCSQCHFIQSAVTDHKFSSGHDQIKCSIVMSTSKAHGSPPQPIGLNNSMDKGSHRSGDQRRRRTTSRTVSNENTYVHCKVLNSNVIVQSYIHSFCFLCSYSEFSVQQKCVNLLQYFLL